MPQDIPENPNNQEEEGGVDNNPTQQPTDNNPTRQPTNNQVSQPQSQPSQQNNTPTLNYQTWAQIVSQNLGVESLDAAYSEMNTLRTQRDKLEEERDNLRRQLQETQQQYERERNEAKLNGILEESDIVPEFRTDAVTIARELDIDLLEDNGMEALREKRPHLFKDTRRGSEPTKDKNLIPPRDKIDINEHKEELGVRF